MAKTNAERQKAYRERKKAKDGSEYLEKERLRQKKNYTKVKDLSERELKKRREAVRMRVTKHRKDEKELIELSNKIITASVNSPVSSTSSESSPLLVAMAFPKRGESARKRKRRSDDRFRKKLAKLEHEKEVLKKSNASLRQKVCRMKKSKVKDSARNLTPRKLVSNMLKEGGLSPSTTSKDIKKNLLFAHVVSEEIRASTLERKNKRASIRRMVSGRILKKYKLIKFAANKTGNDRRKMGRSSSKILNFPSSKRGFDPAVHKSVLEFYSRDDISTALPGKRDCKKVKKSQIQKRSLNDYLSNLYHKLKSEQPNLKVSFASFAKMRPKHFILANFVNRRSCLCTKHQNLALKLKMLKTLQKTVQTNPDTFIKQTSDDDIKKILQNCKVKKYEYEEWQKVDVQVKTKSGEEKTKKKMKVLRKSKCKADFDEYFLKEATMFREHAKRIKNQYVVQKSLKENLLPNHIYIHMDFAEDYKCRSQEEIQSAYWSQTQVTIHPVVAYFKKEGKVVHQSFVYISDEPRHDARFVFALLRSLVPQLLQLIPKLEFVHYWTDSPTSQYRNKTIFKIISCHREYFDVSATWNYMEAGHGKGPCDPIGGTAKRKADYAVKHAKAIIQDAQEFYQWAKTTEDTSKIKFMFLSSDEYENAASFLKNACFDIESVSGTMKIHAVFPHEVNRIWVREMSCFCQSCFTNKFHSETACHGWRMANLKSLTNVPARDQEMLPEVNEHVAAIYDRAVYIGKVIDVDDTDAHISFYEHNGMITHTTVFRVPKRKDEIWISYRDILCILPEPVVTKRGIKFDEAIVDEIQHRFSDWKKKIKY